jgi:hypothetical protein
MDLSKLPKLSQTPPPPDNAVGPVAPQPGVAAGSPGTKVELFCRCGAPITPGTNFCSHCGANYYEAVGGRGGGGAGRSDMPGATGGLWIEAFLSIAIGLFLVMIAPGGVKYLSATFSGRAYTPYDDPNEVGKKVDFLRYQDMTTQVVTDYKYPDLFDAYWSDMAVTAFALALILEGVVIAVVRNRWAVLVAAIILSGVTILNLWYVLASYSRVSPITKQTYGFPPLSAIAVIFGVVMVGYQLMMFRELSATERRR